MKKMIKYLMILCVAAFAGAACTDSTEYDNIDVRPIDGLLYPSNGSTIDLYLYSTSKTNFEWKKSTGTQMYTVVFYAADKTTELGSYMADNNGLNNHCQMPHTVLSAVAESAGIAAGKSGDIYWNVINNAGSASSIGATPSKVTLVRYKSALEQPYRLYITGEGSEGGAEFAQAIPMKNNGNSFEIYTKITGNVSFVNRNEDGNKMTIGFNEEGEFTYGDEAYGVMPAGVYRVTVNFQQSEVKCELIKSVKMMRGNGNLLVDMSYTGKSVWNSAQKITINHGGEDRYRFLAEVGDHKEVWGSTRGDRDASEPSTILANDPYYTLHINTNLDAVNDAYSNMYKLWRTRLEGEQAMVAVHMTTDRLYHEFTLDFPLTVVPVVGTLTAPTAGEKLMLSSTPGAESEFKWAVPTGNAPQLKLTTYKVVFSKDAAGQEVVGTALAEWANSVKVKHSDLESYAAAAGVESATSGDVYWSVQTTVEGTSKTSATRKVVLRRFVSMPTTAYITGAGSEYNATYGKMHVITDDGKDKGKFEIYVQMTKGGKFDMTTDTDPTSDAYTKFEFKSLKTGGAFEENGNADNSFTPDNGIYRLVVDFNADTIGLQKVENVRFVSLVVSNEPYALDYKGNGTWGKDNFIPKFKGGWDDDRFVFFADYDGDKTKIGWNATGSPEIATEPLPGDPSYWVYFTGEMSDWDYALHILKSYRANTTKKANLTLNMNGDDKCSHPFTYINYLDK